MAALKSWVQSLVILVLLGACLEMLLPMGSMKKYVKLTMGFLVVLTVVRPIAALLGHPVELNLAQVVSAPDPRLPTLGQIMAQGAEFRAKSQGLALTQARGLAAQEAEAAAKEVAGVGGATAQVEMALEAGEPKLQAVTVTLQQNGGVAPVKPVVPVSGGQTAAPVSASTKEPVPADPALAEAVRQAVARRLGVDPQVIRVLAERRP